MELIGATLKAKSVVLVFRDILGTPSVIDS